MFYIYRHVTPEGKSYIGKTQNPKHRYNNGKGYKSCPKFYEAIKKYGWDNIEHQILYTTNDEAEARGLEKDMIKKYSSIENGYNMVNRRAVYVSKRKKEIPKYGQYDLEGNLIKIYVGSKELWSEGFVPDYIRSCCKGKIKTTYGYVWKIEK